ncbi:MAG: glycosyltransferase [Bacteroidota bacterium]
MAQILCLTSGLTGITNASLELVKRLERAGHEVTFGSTRPIGELVAANEIDYLQLPPVNFFPGGQDKSGGGLGQRLQKWWYRWQNRKERRAEAVKALGMDVFADQLRSLKPGLLIIDIELHEHLMTAVVMGIPTVLVSPWFSLWQRPGLPPLMQDTIPGQGWRGSAIGLSWAWWLWRWQRRWMFGKKYLRSVGTNRRSVLLAYAREIGFPLHYVPDNYWPGPLTYSSLPVISVTIQEMEFSHDPQPWFTYVGAMVKDQRREAQKDMVLTDQLDQIFEDCRTNNKRLICCTVSTFKAGDTAFLKRLLVAVEKRLDWVLILGLGAKLQVSDLGEIPANTYVFPWIPQMNVLAHADCSINHAGIHTINECIHFRVPMLIYSGKRSDQNGCAARAHYHQIGIMADKDRDDSTAIERKIEEVLDSSSIRASLEQMHHYYKRYKDTQVLERYVDDILTKEQDSAGIASGNLGGGQRVDIE